MKTALLALACAAALSATSAPAAAQHAGHHPSGHTGHAAPPAKKKPVAKPATKPAAKKPAARRTATKTAKPAASKPAAPTAGRGAPARGPSTRKTTVAPVSARTHAHHAADGAVDHAAMGHAAPSATAVDHAAMGHAPRASDAPAVDHAQMDHGAMGHTPSSDARDPHADHAAMGHALPDLPADAAPRMPIPAITDADRAAAFPPVSGHAAHDRGIHSFWLADRLEWQDTDEGALAWEGLAWIGGDVDRAWLRTEGEAEDGRIDHANVELLYGRAVTAWWDVVAGVRHDFGEGPSRTWAAFGVQGLAPYKFEVEATAYIGDGGRTAASLEAEYDTLLTNRLILQWTAEASMHGKGDPARGIGSGLSTVEAGARLRYEITRRFAPYVGVERERAFGSTAELRRHEGHDVDDTRLVAGVRFWF